MDEVRQAGYLGSKLDEAWSHRVKAAEDWNSQLDKGEIHPDRITRLTWVMKALRSGQGYHEKIAVLEKQWRESDGRKEPSLAWALNDTFGRSFWLGGIFKVVELRFSLHKLSRVIICVTGNRRHLPTDGTTPCESYH